MAMPDKDKTVSKDLSDQIGQVIEIVTDYAQQETLGPIRGAGKWLAAGAAGAMLIGTGCAVLVLGLLRLVQNEFGKSFRGTWTSMLPYLFALIASVAVMGVAFWRISKKKTLQKERR
jgi:hypothetical protein